MTIPMRISATIHFIVLGLSPGAWAAPPETAQVDRLVIESTNGFRREEGASAVERNPQLEAAARAFAQYMAQTGRYGHEVDGSSPSDRARSQGYDYCIVSENIAYAYDSRGFSTPELARKFFEGWKTSPGHRKNMLDRAVTDTAVAVALSPRSGYYYAVQMFGRPRSASIRLQIRNASGETVRYRLGDETFAMPPGAIRRHTQCREEILALEAAREGRTLTRDADRFVVTGQGSRIVLKRE
jgi:Cysteine-rich secretory protein family